MAAQAAGRFKEEIVAADVNDGKGVKRFEVDEAPRPDTTRGVVTLCIGGGQGIALALEKV